MALGTLRFGILQDACAVPDALHLLFVFVRVGVFANATRNRLSRPVLEVGGDSILYGSMVEAFPRRVDLSEVTEVIPTDDRRIVLRRKTGRDCRISLREISSACGLVWDDERLAAAAQGIESRNFKWREAFDPSEIATLNEVLCEAMSEFGYEPDAG